MSTHTDVVDFWFGSLQPEQWFRQSDEVDDLIVERFASLYEEAVADRLDPWLNEPEGALGLVIILDQFPRNMFRGHERSFAFDHKAREVARAAISKGFDMKLPPMKRIFLYMPFMHSENLVDQDYCIDLIANRMGEAGKINLVHARAHRHVIEVFGRFPFRNEALDRTSTPDEIRWLEQGAYQSAVRLIEEKFKE